LLWSSLTIDIVVNRVNVCTVNPKQTVATRVTRETLERLEKLAEEDRRTLSAVMAMAIELGLPELEREVLGAPAKRQRREVPA